MAQTTFLTEPVALFEGQRGAMAHSDVTAAASMREVASLFPAARMATVMGSHHHVPMDKPARLAAMVDDFARQLP